MIKDIRGPLRGFLLSDPEIEALIGTRIYPRVMPQGLRDPCLVYNRISMTSDHHMRGTSGLVEVRMQIDAWSDTADHANVIAAAVRWRLDGYRGAMASVASPPDVVAVQGVFFSGARDDFDGGRELYRESSDYMLHYGER